MDLGNTFSDQSVEKIRRAIINQELRLANAERRLATFGTRRHQTVYIPSQPNTVEFRNNSGETVPYGSVMCISSTESGSKTNSVRYVITKPTTTLERVLLVCQSASGVANGANGEASWLFEGGFVAYDTGTPAIGESWGPKPSQWTLSKWRYGFTVTGTTQTINGVACISAIQQPVDEFRGKTDATHNKGSSGTVSVYDGNGTDTTINVSSVENIFANVATTKAVMCRWCGGKWQLVDGEC